MIGEFFLSISHYFYIQRIRGKTRVGKIRSEGNGLMMIGCHLWMLFTDLMSCIIRSYRRI
jgi:hypothetical protein